MAVRVGVDIGAVIAEASSAGAGGVCFVWAAAAAAMDMTPKALVGARASPPPPPARRLAGVVVAPAAGVAPTTSRDASLSRRPLHSFSTRYTLNTCKDRYNISAFASAVAHELTHLKVRRVETADDVSALVEKTNPTTRGTAPGAVVFLLFLFLLSANVRRAHLTQHGLRVELLRRRRRRRWRAGGDGLRVRHQVPAACECELGRKVGAEKLGYLKSEWGESTNERGAGGWVGGSWLPRSRWRGDDEDGRIAHRGAPRLDHGAAEGGRRRCVRGRHGLCAFFFFPCSLCRHRLFRLTGGGRRGASRCKSEGCLRRFVCVVHVRWSAATGS
jgi:hypothetical protein